MAASARVQGQRATGAPVDRSLRLPAATWRLLLERMGPSLGLWRAAEIAAIRSRALARPILDVGCGDGLVAAVALGRVDVGVDPDPAQLARAAATGCYERLVPAPVERVDLPPGAFATALSNSVLEHVPDVDAALSAIARLLRPGGRLVMTAPTEAFSGALALPLPRYAAWRNRRLGHLNLWSVDDWSERLGRAGLAVEVVVPYLRPSLVRLWDALELAQQVWVRDRRVFGLAWRRIPPAGIERLAGRLARLDLAAPPPGGGRLIVARKRGEEE